MSKPWSEHSEDEKKEILERLGDIYAEHKNPTWLKPPTVTTQIVNVLNANTQQLECFMEVKGDAPPEEAGSVATLTQKVKDALISVEKAQVKIGSCRGVGA
jgi:hypothetical protein